MSLEGGNGPEIEREAEREGEIKTEGNGPDMRLERGEWPGGLRLAS